MKTEDYHGYVAEWNKNSGSCDWVAWRGGLHPIAFPVPVPSADTRKSCLRLGVDVALALRLYFLSFIVSTFSLFLFLKIKKTVCLMSKDSTDESKHIFRILTVPSCQSTSGLGWAKVVALSRLSNLTWTFEWRSLGKCTSRLDCHWAGDNQEVVLIQSQWLVG